MAMFLCFRFSNPLLFLRRTGNAFLTEYQCLDREEQTQRVAAAACYLGPLCLIPYLFAARGSFCRRHALRGMDLMLYGCGYTFAARAAELACSRLLWQAGMVIAVLLGVVGLFFPLLSLIGMRAALWGRVVRLPLIGRIRIVRQ